MMRALVMADEPLAQTTLATVLRARDDVESFDVASDGVEALEKLRHEAYDLLLLDINPPSISGVELLDQLRAYLRSIPSVVFVTAHQEHAFTAFQRHAVDYVLKPFSTQRLNEALERAVQKYATQRTMKMCDGFPMHGGTARPGPPRIAIKARGRIILIDPFQIASVHAEGNYALLQRGPTTYLLRESISDLLIKLKPYGFIRIHRSFLVNGSMVEEIRPYATGGYRVRIKGGNEYPVARSYRKNLRSLADCWIGNKSFLAD